MILLEAESTEEAKAIFDKDPIIERGHYRYELVEWDILLKSKAFNDIF